MKLMSVASKSYQRSQMVAIRADNLTVSVPQSSERPLVERKIDLPIIVLFLGITIIFLSAAQALRHQSGLIG